MTSDHARRIAQEVADGIFGAGASETQRLGALAVSTIHRLADQIDAGDTPEEPETEPDGEPEAEPDEADEPAPKKPAPSAKKKPPAKKAGKKR